MTKRRAALLGWLSWSLGLTLLMAGFVLGASQFTHLEPMPVLVGISQGFAVVALGAVGLTLAIRRPDNPIGWLYLLVWILLAAGAFAFGFADWAADQAVAVHGEALAVWFKNWYWVPPIGVLLTFPFLLFPTGHLLSSRWRPVSWSAGVVVILWSIAFAFEGENYSDITGRSIPNPFTPGGQFAAFNLAKNLLSAPFLVIVALSVASVLVRFRRAAPTERAQLKWLMLSGSFMLLVLLYPGDRGDTRWIDAAMGVALALLPISIGVAVLRYHLFDIDRVISRTASYTIVTGFVVATYIVVVALISPLVRGSSSLAIAAATLTAAAIARPVLRRVQEAVDRRFDRARYDGQRTVDALGARLRDAVDVGLVSRDLVAAVNETLAPTKVSLWVRETP